MDVSHTLTLNEGALKQLPVEKKPYFIFEWLRFLDKVLVAAQKSDIKSCQQKLVAQLMSLLNENLGAPARHLLARCLATLFSVGDTFLLFDTVNKCNDIIKVKDDSPSYLPTRLAAICCLGGMYEKLGRMMGRSYEETVTTLVKSLKNAESVTRLEIMTTLEKICVGMGTAAPVALREVSRTARAALISDRANPVRVAAAHCMRHMLPLMKLTPADVDSIAAACLRAAHPSDYRVRCAVAELLGSLIAATQAGEANNLSTKMKSTGQSAQSKKDAPKNVVSLEEALNLLMGAFLRGGTSFLKGEIIKSGSGVNREVRVCVTNAYVIFVQTMGSVWLERNINVFLTHILDLVANPKAASSHVDAVYSRKCISYILRNTLGKILGEKAQASACKEIIKIIIKQMNTIDFNPENAKDCNQETLFSQHLLVCALLEAGELSLQLGTSVQNLVSDNSLNMIDAVCSVLEHPCVAARLAASQCIRCICIASPSQITPLLDRCLTALERTPHISGYASCVSALLGGVRVSCLGIPHGRGKIAFNAAEQLLRSANQSSRLTTAKTHAGWLLVGAICTLGAPVVRGLLPRMLLLWRNSFPRSAKELESEKARGDAFTWQVTLEGRAGALSALHSLLVHCPSLVDSEDTAKRLAQPIEGAVAVLANVGDIVRNYGGALKAPVALLRLRTYMACAALGGTNAAAAPLLRLLAAELVGTADSNNANVATGLLRSAMHPRDTILLEDSSWIYDTDHADIEEQLIFPLSMSGSSALEHDACHLFLCEEGALPLGVNVLDKAVALFPHLFARAANKHRQQMLEHFAECIKTWKGQRQECVQINVLSALLLAFRTLSETKSLLGQPPVNTLAVDLVISCLSSPSQLVRAAAASCVGRLAGCLSEAEAQALAERVLSIARTSTNKSARAAAAVALSALSRGRGAGSSAAALPVLRAMAMDHSSTELQIWSVHALSVLVDAAGPMFHSHVEATLNLAFKLLFTVPPYQEHLHRCIGRLVSALVTVVGPELQEWSSVSASRVVSWCNGSSSICASASSESLAVLQQLHMFAQQHLNTRALVHTLARDLSSPELSVRRAALCCLRQLSQKEAMEICRYQSNEEPSNSRPYQGVVITETGLPGALFALLDVERDEAIISYTKDTLTCCLLASTSIKDWLMLCKRVLTVKAEESSSNDVDLDGEGDDDQAQFHAQSELTTHPAVQPRWPTRVFAMECIQKLMSACEASGEMAHFDLVLAKEKLRTNPNGDYLSLHLSELVRMSFMGATGESDPLKLISLKTLQIIIRMFARADEPDFPGHMLLEQYQAQVGAALRPAFGSESPPDVSASASDVCSQWLGSGLARDLTHLRRVHHLLVSNLDKLNTKGNTTLIYNESMATLEKLSILKAWAEVYIVAMVGNNSAPCCYIKQLETKPINNDMEIAKWRNELLQSSKVDNREDEYGEFESKGESLLKLVEPELEGLSSHWLAALRDHALLSLPPEFSSQLPHSGGAFYSAETAQASRIHYATAWPSLLYASALRFNAQIGQPHESPDGNKDDNKNENVNSEFYEPVDQKFHLLFGICMEALCAQRDMRVEDTINVLLSLVTLLHAQENRARILKDKALSIEFCQIIHRTGLTQESIEALLLAVEVLKLVITGAKEHLQNNMDAKIKELSPNEISSPPQSVLSAVLTVGEGGPCGDLPPGKSLSFSLLELSLCLAVRRLPQLSPKKQLGQVGVIGHPKGLGRHGDTLIIHTLHSLAYLTDCTSPQGALSILPTILYIAMGVLKEAKDNSIIAESAILLLQQACQCKTVRMDEETNKQFAELLQSSLSHMVDLVKNDEPEHRIDPVWGAKAMSVLISHTEPSSSLHYPCINHCRVLLESSDDQRFTQSCSVIGTLWSTCPSTCLSWWARALSPLLIARAAKAHNCTQPSGMQAAVAALNALDLLLEAAPDHSRIPLLKLLVPIVISYLKEGPELSRAPAHVKSLHEFALQWLTKIGPKYPQEFKTMMQQSSELRSRLESAVKASQNDSKRINTQRPVFEARQAKPTIQLKTDFSDFR